MPIVGNFSPSPGAYGDMAFNAGANMESQSRLQQYQALLAQLRKMNQDYQLGQEKNAIDATTSEWQKEDAGRKTTLLEKQQTLQEQLQASQMEYEKARLRLAAWQAQIGADTSMAQIKGQILQATSKYGITPMQASNIEKFLVGESFDGTNFPESNLGPSNSAIQQYSPSRGFGGGYGSKFTFDPYRG